MSATVGLPNAKEADTPDIETLASDSTANDPTLNDAETPDGSTTAEPIPEAAVVAAEKDVIADEDPRSWSHVRVATKYPNITRKHFESRGVHAECIKLNGAMELAPSMGLCKRIVDLVETGSTLKANGLVVVEEICEVSTRLAVNRSYMKTNLNTIQPWIEKVEEAINV